MSRTIALAIAATTVLAAAAAAQMPPLGEVARQEQARRGSVRKPSRVYTNADLVPGEAPAPPPAPAASPPPSSPPGAQPPAPPPDPAPDEKAWRDRIARAREQVARSEMFLDALQSRINALTADFSARDDPAQRAAIAADRQKALAELERVRREIDEQKAAVARIQEEARRAGVPPGWLR